MVNWIVDCQGEGSMGGVALSTIKSQDEINNETTIYQ